MGTKKQNRSCNPKLVPRKLVCDDELASFRIILQPMERIRARFNPLPQLRKALAGTARTKQCEQNFSGKKHNRSLIQVIRAKRYLRALRGWPPLIVRPCHG